MPDRSNKYSDTFTEQQYASIIADWVEAMKQLQQWYNLLDTAIDGQSNPYGSENSREEKGKTAVVDLIKLRTKIDDGLIRLTKEVSADDKAANVPLELLRLVEHTETVLLWCIEVKQVLGMNSGSEYQWISAN
ncbi:hypothetical protein [Spirosoma oryzicola]|uniref:hypothetical protein n=1 Tax=Spirosoma oryzicola TaxID=2898794 RepID=UPI001E586396|nr:hypothetical protein [Spirosoma oryzicola]UHG89016.1 hypothetical protein LQ777_12235 [Spirosoma oryzicola]